MAASHPQDINTKSTWFEGLCSLCYIVLRSANSQWWVCIRLHFEF